MRYWQHAIMKASRDWLEIDHGYFMRGHFYRASVGSFWCRTDGEPDFDRLDKLKVSIAKRRKHGGAIMLVLQSDEFYRLYCGCTAAQYATKVSNKLRRFTSRPIVIRHKPILRFKRLPKFDQVIGSAAVIVAHSSATLLTGLATGRPVVCLEPRYPASYLSTPLEKLDNAEPPDPEKVRHLFGILAANQWTVAEMAAGKTWARLKWESATNY